MHQLFFAIPLLLLIAGCSARTPIKPPVDVGVRVQVNAQFDALPNATRIQFQGGQRIQEGNLDKWTTYCRLHVYNRNHGADYVTAVSPGNFEVSRVEVRYQSSDHPPGTSYAGLNWNVREIPAYYVYMVLMRLTSPDQPDVKTLNCFKKWSTPRANQYPTLVEIRQALGNLVEIKPTSTTGAVNDSNVNSNDT